MLIGKPLIEDQEQAHGSLRAGAYVRPSMTRKATKAAAPAPTRRSEHVKRDEGKAVDNKSDMKRSTLGARGTQTAKDKANSRLSGISTGHVDRFPSRSTSHSRHRRRSAPQRSSYDESAPNGGQRLGPQPAGQKDVSKPERPQHMRREQPLSPSSRLLRPQSPTSSVISFRTDVTGTSSSSNQTVTQASYTQAREPAYSKIDVFSFLVEEPTQQNPSVPSNHEQDEDESSWDSDSDSGSSGGTCDASCCDSHADTDTHSTESSGYWDSGVSMSGDSPVLPRGRRRVPLESPGADETPTDNVATLRVLEQEDPCDAETRVPGGFPGVQAHFRETPPPAPSPPPAYQYPVRPTRPPSSHEPQRPKAHGYDLVAREYCSEDPDAAKPIYRRFERLQHRTLLHLQDQICEVEAELKRADDQIAALTLDEHSFRQPQSRRLDRMHPNLGWRRHQLLDYLSHYLAQYNQILASHQAIANGHDKPSKEQIEAAKAWFYENQPIPTDECGFLQHAPDLVLLKQHPTLFNRDWPAFASGGFAGLVCFVLILILCKFI